MVWPGLLALAALACDAGPGASNLPPAGGGSGDPSAATGGAGALTAGTGSAAPEAPPGATEPARGAAGGGDGAGAERAPGDDPRAVVLFLGTSLTAGLGVSPEEAYPAVIQARIDSVGLPYRVVNAGVSGETSAGGLRRAAWIAEQPIDVLVLELGANDGLRGHDPASTRDNLLAIIDTVRARHPEVAVVVVGMEAPPNLGDEYTTRFRGIFAEVASARGAALVPFLLEDVAGIPALNQSDGIHPTPEGHRIMAGNVWRVLEPLLREREARRGTGG